MMCQKLLTDTSVNIQSSGPTFEVDVTFSTKQFLTLSLRLLFNSMEHVEEQVLKRNTQKERPK